VSNKKKTLPSVPIKNDLASIMECWAAGDRKIKIILDEELRKLCRRFWNEILRSTRRKRSHKQKIHPASTPPRNQRDQQGPPAHRRGTPGLHLQSAVRVRSLPSSRVDKTPSPSVG
jgi:hypothetical protein